MRALAHIAAFAIILLVGYLLATQGYQTFWRQTHSHVAAQFLTFVALIVTTMAMIWATRKIP